MTGTGPIGPTGPTCTHGAIILTPYGIMGLDNIIMGVYQATGIYLVMRCVGWSVVGCVPSDEPSPLRRKKRRRTA